MTDSNDSLLPFPALTSGQRLFLEINDYVVVETRCRMTRSELRLKFMAADPEVAQRQRMLDSVSGTRGSRADVECFSECVGSAT